MKKTLTYPSHTYQPTSDANVQRFVDREGNWTHYWLVNEKRFVKAVNHILRLGYPKGDGLFQWLKNTTAEEADRKLKTAGEEGTRTHQAIRDLAAGNRITTATPYHNDLTKRKEPLSEGEWDNLQAYVNFMHDYPQELIAEEFVVYDSVKGYAGTADRFCLLTVPEGDKKFPKEQWGKQVVALIDWKTSSGIWPEYYLQLSAYFGAMARMNLFPEFGKGFAACAIIVRLGTKHTAKYEIKVMTPQDILNKLNVFSNCIEVAKDQEPTFEPVIEQIPLEFYMPMKMAVAPKVVAKKTKKNVGSKQKEKRAKPRTPRVGDVV
jgi:hypothetical protein